MWSNFNFCWPIVCQYGEVDIDGSLVAAKAAGVEDIIMLNNGCLCCTVRGDLVRMISELVSRKKGKFDHIVIETTGKIDWLHNIFASRLINSQIYHSKFTVFNILRLGMFIFLSSFWLYENSIDISIHLLHLLFLSFQD